MVEYRGIAREVLSSSNASIGDRVEVQGEKMWSGILLEPTNQTPEDVLVLKLKSGYNVGVRVDRRTVVRVLSRGEISLPSPPPLPSAEGLPTVSILATGGTIASFVDYRTGAVHPATTPQELAAAIPELWGVAHLRPRVVFSLFSEDLQPEHWKILAHEIRKEFEEGAQGVVVTHGTDTLGYTAAALSFFFHKGLPGPVVLVGAQRSSDRPSSDSAMNLYSAVVVAAKADLGEVVVVMHAASSDDRCLIHRGTRVRKLHTSRRDAFQSVNAPPLGYVENGTPVLLEPFRRPIRGPPEVDDALDEEVSMILSYPGLWPEHLEKVVLKGVVLVGTGLGHIARRNLEIVRAITRGFWSDGRPRLRYDGKVAGPSSVVMTSQCLFGRVNMNVYSTGRDLLEAGVIPAEDMLPEVAYVKLMWVLGHTTDPEEVRRRMQTNYVGEIGERSPLEAPVATPFKETPKP